MNAKMLSQLIEGYERCNPPFLPPVVLEALKEYRDLLAAVEDSTDEIVRELRGQHCRDFGSDPQCDADGLCICAMHERAAAALVAERAAKEKAEAERDAMGWEPIETAPKTGRTVLLGYLNELGNWRTVRGQWMDENYIAEYWDDPESGEPGWFETSANADDVPSCWSVNPSHWMPLPKPPADYRAAQEKKP